MWKGLLVFSCFCFLLGEGKLSEGFLEMGKDYLRIFSCFFVSFLGIYWFLMIMQTRRYSVLLYSSVKSFVNTGDRGSKSITIAKEINKHV